MNQKFSILFVLLLFFTVTYCNKTRHPEEPGFVAGNEGRPGCGKSHKHHGGMKALHCFVSIGVLVLFVLGIRKCIQKIRGNRQNRLIQNGYQQGQPVLPMMQNPAQIQMQPIYPQVQAPVQQQQGYFTVPYEQFQQFQLFLQSQRQNSIQDQIYGVAVQQPNIQLGIPQQGRNPYSQLQ